MKTYLSFGGGVNSTALYILMEREGREFEAVFANHGCDWPETYKYVEWMNDNAHPVTSISARRAGLDLYSYYWKYHLIPTRIMRHCTEHFKVRPLHAYMGDEPYNEMLGIDASESHRADRLQREGLSFPLLDRGINRQGCLGIIDRAGWPRPRKSGCFLCPFQRVWQWEELRVKHPDLLAKAIALEQHCADWLVKQERKPFYLADPYPAEICSSGRFARRIWKKQQKGQQNLWGIADLEQCPYCLM